MGSNQKALTWIPTYARKIKNIANNEFYKNCVAYSKSMRSNGTYEQTVANSVMATFHLNDWKKTPNDRNEYLEENSSFDEFEKVNEYGNRIAKVCGNKFQNVFVFKDILCWIATFHNFTKFGLDDGKFAEFVNALVDKLHGKVVGEWSYDILDKETGTSDKKIIQAKISTYTALMMDYLHIDTEVLIENPEETTLSFVQDNANPDATEEDIEFYRDMVEDCVRVDEPVYQQCERAVIAIMAYACMKEEDEEFEKWIQKYKNQTNFSPSQKVNYAYMKSSFDNFIQKKITV